MNVDIIIHFSLCRNLGIYPLSNICQLDLPIAVESSFSEKADHGYFDIVQRAHAKSHNINSV